MAELISILLNLSVLVFAISSMLSVGFGHTVQEIIGPLRHTGRVIRALAANFVLVPLLALVIISLLSLDPSLEVGLILVATAAGAPFLIKLTEAAEGDVALSATLLVLLLPVTIIYMPIVVPLLAPEAQVDAGAIARPLLLTMLLPLALGLLVRERAATLAQRLRPIMGPISSIALVVLVATTFLANLGGIRDIFGTGAILAALLLIGGAFLIGYVIGSPDRERQTVLGLGTGQRNISAATVVATQAIGDPDTTVMVVVSSLVGLAMLFPIARALRPRGAAGAHRLRG